MATRDEYVAAWLKTPEYFSYDGPLEEGVWGRVGEISQNRDSSLLDQSNFAFISKDLTTRFPDTTTTEEYGHWLVGSVEMLRVDTRDDEAVDAVLTWIKKLKEYPVADENDYDLRCLKACEEAWRDWLEWDVERLCETQGWSRFLDAEGEYAATDADVEALRQMALINTHGEGEFDQGEFITCVWQWLGREPYNAAEAAGQLPLEILELGQKQ